LLEGLEEMRDFRYARGDTEAPDPRGLPGVLIFGSKRRAEEADDAGEEGAPVHLLDHFVRSRQHRLAGPPLGRG